MKTIKIEIEVSDEILEGLQHAFGVQSVGNVSNRHINVANGLDKAMYHEAAEWVRENQDIWYLLSDGEYKVAIE